MAGDHVGLGTRDARWIAVSITDPNRDDRRATRVQVSARRDDVRLRRLWVHPRILARKGQEQAGRYCRLRRHLFELLGPFIRRCYSRTENREDARFCLTCRASLTVPCPECGRKLPPEAQFCDACGTELGPAEAAPPSAALDATAQRPQRLVPKGYAERLLATHGQVRPERCTVTMLFSDVKGSTVIAETLDPRDWGRSRRVPSTRSSSRTETTDDYRRRTNNEPPTVCGERSKCHPEAEPTPASAPQVSSLRSSQ